MEHGFAGLCKLWLDKIKIEKNSDARKSFDRVGDIIQRVYEEDHDFLYEADEDSVDSKEGNGFSLAGIADRSYDPPGVRVTYNVFAEFVHILGPLLYNRNPVRTVQAKKFWEPDQDLVSIVPELQAFAPRQDQPWQMQQEQQPQQQEVNPLLQQGMAGMPGPQQPMPRIGPQEENMIKEAAAQIQQAVLNYTPNELDLKSESRKANEEALLRGRGCLWTEFYFPPESQTFLIGTFYEPIANICIDPDATCLRDAKWIARKKRRAIWEVAREFGIEEKALKGKGMTTDAAVSSGMDGMQESNAKESTADLVTYYEVYSKMGAGLRLKNTKGDTTTVQEQQQLTEVLGDYVYLVLVPNVQWPINISREDLAVLFGPDQPATFPPQLDPMGNPMPNPKDQALENIRAAVAWPIPFWRDNEWPATFIDLHDRPDCLWPYAHLKPVLGEQAFLDWLHSMMASKLHTTLRTIIALSGEIETEDEDKLLHGGDLATIRLGASQRSVSDLLQIINHPQMNPDTYQALEIFERRFQQGSGLTDFMYGQTAHAMRSAEEAGRKAEYTQIRPDDMMTTVEEAATKCARKEAKASRFFLSGEAVAPIVGQAGAAFWNKYIANSDWGLISLEYDYRIEAGSARKPDKDKQIADTNEAVQYLAPVLQALAQQTGYYEPLNELIRYWARARDIDVNPFVFDPQKLQAMQQEQQAAQQQQEAQAQEQQAQQQPQQQGMDPMQMMQHLEQMVQQQQQDLANKDKLMQQMLALAKQSMQSGNVARGSK